MLKEGTEGVIIETLPSNLYKVEFPDGKALICYLAGKMRINKIRVIPGDKVKVIIDPYKGKTTNRIIERL